MNFTTEIYSLDLNSSSRKTLLDKLLQTCPEYISKVPEFWLVQETPTPIEELAMNVCYLILCLPANVSQILILFVFCRSRQLRTASNRLLMSLSVADIMVLINCYQIVIQSFLGGPTFGPRGCEFYGFWGTLGALGEIWSLTAITYDRYQSIKYPLNTSKRLNSNQVYFVLGIIWTFALAFAAAPLLGWNRYVSEAYLIGCSFDNFSLDWVSIGYVWTLILLAWIFPMVFITIAYGNIISIFKSETLFSDGCKNRSFADQQRHMLEVQLTKMVCIILLVWLIAWTPYAVMSVWITIFKGEGLTIRLAMIPTMCCKLSASVNAFLYGVGLPKFKRELKLMMGGICPRFGSCNFVIVEDPSKNTEASLKAQTSKSAMKVDYCNSRIHYNQPSGVRMEIYYSDDI